MRPALLWHVLYCHGLQYLRRYAVSWKCALWMPRDVWAVGTRQQQKRELCVGLVTSLFSLLGAASRQATAWTLVIFDTNLTWQFSVSAIVSETNDFSRWWGLLFTSSVQFSRSVVSDSATPWITACQASLSITNSLKLMSIESVMPSSHLILCRPLLLLPPIPPSIRVFSNKSSLRMRWPKYWSFSFSIGRTAFQWTPRTDPLGWTGRRS